MILNWTSDHVFNTLLILAAVVYVVWLVRGEMEIRRFFTWVDDPYNDWRQALYAAHGVQRPHDPTICKCRCMDHGYIGGGMHFVACCEPCPICHARIGQSAFPQTGYRHEEHRAIAHPTDHL